MSSEKVFALKDFNHSLIRRQIDYEKYLVNQVKDIKSYLVYFTVLQRLQSKINKDLAYYKSKIMGEMKHKNQSSVSHINKYFAEIRRVPEKRINYKLLRKFLPNEADYNRVVYYEDIEDLYVTTPETTKRLKNYV